MYSSFIVNRMFTCILNLLAFTSSQFWSRRVGRGSCTVDWIHFVSRWHERSINHALACWYVASFRRYFVLLSVEVMFSALLVCSGVYPMLASRALCSVSWNTSRSQWICSAVVCCVRQ